jgi:hypothetical protein
MKGGFELILLFLTEALDGTCDFFAGRASFHPPADTIDGDYPHFADHAVPRAGEHHGHDPQLPAAEGQAPGSPPQAPKGVVADDVAIGGA